MPLEDTCADAIVYGDFIIRIIFLLNDKLAGLFEQ